MSTFYILVFVRRKWFYFSFAYQLLFRHCSKQIISAVTGRWEFKVRSTIPWVLLEIRCANRRENRSTIWCDCSFCLLTVILWYTGASERTPIWNTGYISPVYHNMIEKAVSFWGRPMNILVLKSSKVKQPRPIRGCFVMKAKFLYRRYLLCPPWR